MSQISWCVAWCSKDHGWVSAELGFPYKSLWWKWRTRMPSSAETQTPISEETKNYKWIIKNETLAVSAMRSWVWRVLIDEIWRGRDGENGAGDGVGASAGWGTYTGAMWKHKASSKCGCLGVHYQPCYSLPFNLFFSHFFPFILFYWLLLSLCKRREMHVGGARGRLRHCCCSRRG